MILYQNLPRLCEQARAASRVLDVGGWHNPFNLATHVIDIGAYGTRRRHDSLDPENAERFTADTWIIHDICGDPWPFADKSFDFAICSHTLEDVRDPIRVCRELSRVARRGYVETPSRLREIFCKKRFPRLSFLAGRAPEIGFRHHRWFCEIENDGLVFTAKTAQLAENPAYYLTRGELGGKLSEAESGICLWWEDNLPAREAILDDVDRALRDDKQRALTQRRAR